MQLAQAGSSQASAGAAGAELAGGLPKHQSRIGKSHHWSEKDWQDGVVEGREERADAAASREFTVALHFLTEIFRETQWLTSHLRVVHGKRTRVSIMRQTSTPFTLLGDATPFIPRAAREVCHRHRNDHWPQQKPRSPPSPSYETSRTLSFSWNNSFHVWATAEVCPWQLVGQRSGIRGSAASWAHFRRLCPLTWIL